MSSNGHTPATVLTSVDFSTSRTTLTENNPETTARDEFKGKYTYETQSYQPLKRTWVANLLEMFCVKWPKRSKTPEEAEFGPSTWPSPWILPVHVLSSHQDSHRHPITKLAKCTIDTGNMQGNIVSREFVEKVLGFTSSSFLALTKEEESGASCIAGDSHIPQGAINLTWYHKNSTRVFRDMRFLVSPNQHCDLIIGARSIQKDKILNVPCLMGDIMQDRKAGSTKESDREKLAKGVWAKDGELDDINNHIRRLKREGDYDKKIPGLTARIPILEDEKKIHELTLKIWDLTKAMGMSDEEKRKNCEPLWEQIRGTYQSDGIKDALQTYWNDLWGELGCEGKYYMPATSSTWGSGAATGDETSGLKYRA